MRERLQKIIAAAGLMARRKAEEAIREGRVTVNGVPAALGDSADPAMRKWPDLIPTESLFPKRKRSGPCCSTSPGAW